ncbi:permease-like cell division protein FtsX [Cetobacterium somerae]|uniref:permease-like cell division protein FtsX n=1 Tax=Cetobacterium somerae TaxID=188913 RepID=UPI003D7675BB
MESRKGMRTFIALTFSFIIFNIFISLSSNSYFIGKVLKNNYFLTIELQNEGSKDKIQEFERFLLENQNVRGTRFLSKEEAFRNLQKELEIVIPKSENPLPNSIIVYFKEEKNLHAIQELLDVNPMVREIYIDSQFLQSTQRKISAANMSLFICLILSLGMYYPITTILRGTIIRDYMIFSIKAPQNKRNFMIARNKNLIPFFVSSLVGAMVFFNIYIILSESYQKVLSNLILQSFKQIILVEVLATALLLFLAWKSTGKLKRDEV